MLPAVLSVIIKVFTAQGCQLKIDGGKFYGNDDALLFNFAGSDYTDPVVYINGGEFYGANNNAGGCAISIQRNNNFADDKLLYIFAGKFFSRTDRLVWHTANNPIAPTSTAKLITGTAANRTESNINGNNWNSLSGNSQNAGYTAENGVWYKYYIEVTGA